MGAETKMGLLMMVTSFWLCLASLRVNGRSDKNPVFEPCADTLVRRRWDGFSVGFAFASNDSFFFNDTLLSPCDGRLSLDKKSARWALFRPTVDQLSLLTINTTTESIDGGYVVAFAGRNYAARSSPHFVSNETRIITSLTLVLEFEKGRLQNLHWINEGCKGCRGNLSFCYNGELCVVDIKNCKTHGGSIDCILGIQLAFQGTDKDYSVLNSWYEVDKAHRYSLFGLFDNLKDLYNAN